MAINRAPWNALQDDDGSNLVGTVWNKDKIKTVLLDPIDAMPLSRLCFGPSLTVTAGGSLNDFRPPTGDAFVVWLWNATSNIDCSGILAEPDGTQHLFINITSFSVTLHSQHVASAVGNRIVGPGFATYTLAPWLSIWAIYSANLQSWILQKA